MLITAAAGELSTGTIELGYDSAGRFVSEQYSDGKLVGHKLDADGNLTKLTYPDGYFVTYGYDQLNRLTDVFLNGSSAAAVHQTFDSLSRLSKRTLSNGAETLFAYDGSNALASIAHVYNPTNSTNFAYSYNKAHDLISQSVSDSNEMSQPSGSVRNDYVSNNLNQYTSINSAAVTNDTNGNVTQFDSSSFVFNTDNELTNATVDGVTCSFEYDARGRLSLIFQPSTDTTRFIYEGYRQLADYDSVTGALSVRHILEPSSLQTFADVTHPARRPLGTKICSAQPSLEQTPAGASWAGTTTIHTARLLRFPGAILRLHRNGQPPSERDDER